MSKNPAQSTHKPVNAAVIQRAYAEAFGKHYPHVKVEFQKTKNDHYFVLLNGDNGGLPLSLDDMKEATANFNR